ncbi:MAG: hypothetical protein V1766_08640 [Pseudomonadota bacterium]
MSRHRCLILKVAAAAAVILLTASSPASSLNDPDVKVTAELLTQYGYSRPPGCNSK